MYDEWHLHTTHTQHTSEDRLCLGDLIYPPVPWVPSAGTSGMGWIGGDG